MSTQKRSESRPEKGRDSITNMIGATENVLIGAGTAGSAAYAFTQIAAIGNIALATIAATVLAIVMFMVLRALYQFGLRKLPYLSDEERGRSIPAFITALAFTSVLSIVTAAGWLAGPAARNADVQASISRSVEATDTVTTAARTGLAVSGRIEPKKVELIGVRQNEKTVGGFCASGRGGDGPCTAILTTQVVASDRVETELDNIRSDSEVLFNRIEAEQDTLRRVLENKALSYEQRVSEVNASLSRVAIHVSQLQALMPIEALSGLAQTYGQDWSNQGLPAVGAQRLRSMLRPLAQDLRYAVSEMEEARTIKVEGVRPKNTFQLIAENFSAVFPMLMLAALPDVTGCALLLLSYFAARSALERDEFSDEEDGPNPPGPIARADDLSEVKIAAIVRNEIARGQKAANGSASHT